MPLMPLMPRIFRTLRVSRTRAARARRASSPAPAGSSTPGMSPTPAVPSTASRSPALGALSPARATVGLLAIALAATASACTGEDAVSGDSVKIGLLASLSGTYQAVGTDIRDGFQVYLRTHDNKLGGHGVELVIADEGDGAPTAVPAATRLVKRDKVRVLTGIVGGGSVAAVYPVLRETKIPFVGSNGRPALDDVSRVWHTSYLSNETGAAIAEYVADNVPGKVFAIGPDYQGGWDQLGGFTSAYTKAGGELANPDGKAMFTPFPATTNFTPYFSRIKAADPAAVYCFYAGTAAIDFVKQYAQSEVKDLPLYGAGFLTEGGVLTAQGDAARDIYSVLNYSPDLDNAANRAFVAAWGTDHDRPPTTYAMASYDAAAVLDKALASIDGEPTPERINSAIAELGRIDSPRGPWQFSKNTHSPVQKWYLRQVRPDGRALSNTVVGDLATVGG